MHCLSIVFAAGAPVMWKLVFRTTENASAAMTVLCDARAKWNGIIPAGLVELADDFGQGVAIDVQYIAGFMLEDLDQSKLAHIEMSLHEARVRSKAQQMAQNDPAIRQAAMMQGPAVLSPGMLNGRM